MHLRAKYIDIKDPKFEWTTYADNGRKCLVIKNQAGEIECKATVNLPNAALPHGCVFIKDYAENEGLLDELIRLKIVGKAIGYVPTGYVTVPYCKVLA